MDNAAFHKSQRTKDLIESVGCRIIFLPPYSPDLNPIEKFWANMKPGLRIKFLNLISYTIHSHHSSMRNPQLSLLYDMQIRFLILF